MTVQTDFLLRSVDKDQIRTSAWLTGEYRSTVPVPRRLFPNQLVSRNIGLAYVKLSSRGVEGHVLYRYVESDGSTGGG